MPLLRRKRQIAVAIEGTEGTPESLDAGDAGILVFDPTIAANIPKFVRRPAASTLSRLPGIAGVKTGTATFMTELKGSGTQGVAPQWDAAIKACGFQREDVSFLTIGAITVATKFVDGETITGGTSSATATVVLDTVDGTTTLIIKDVAGGPFDAGGETITGGTSGAQATTTGSEADYGLLYRPDSDLSTVPSVTIGGYFDGILKLLSGARGTLTLNAATTGEPVMMEFEFTGVWNDPTDVALLTGIVFDETLPPKFQNAAFLLYQDEDDTEFACADGLVVATSQIAIGNVLSVRFDACNVNGAISVLISDRDPTFTFDPEATLVATFDWFGRWAADNLHRFEYHVYRGATTPGSSSGNVVDVYLNNMDFREISDDEREGIDVNGITAGLNRSSVSSAGDDELYIIVR